MTMNGLKNRIGRYQTDTERGIAFDLSGDPSNNGYQIGTSITPNGGAGLYLDHGGRNLVNGGLLDFNDGSFGIGGSVAFPVQANNYNEINTPLGLLAYGQNANTGQAYANITPNNQYYLQALASLLNRGQ